jgi:hypothetical protein
MNEKIKRRIVFSVFIVVAVVVLCLGVLLAVYNYEAFMASEESVMREWKRHTCCCGTCEYSDEELKMHFIVLTVTTSLSMVLGTLAVAVWLYNKGHNYYRYGCLWCRKEKSEEHATALSL